MTIAILKDQGQITIPEQLLDQLGVQIGDALDISVSGGEIRMKPRGAALTPGAVPRSKGIDIRPYIGSGKGLFAKPADVDAYIESERNSWD